jgi:hypothetical protein
MLRRWIIRSLALALLTLCLTAWVGSYWRRCDVQYKRNFWNDLTVNSGRIDFQRVPNEFEKVARLRFETNNPYDWGDSKGFDYHFIGFGFLHFPRSWELQFPLWFPTTLSAGCLWLVWRKSRPKYSGKGFPVEVGGGGGKEATKP